MTSARAMATRCNLAARELVRPTLAVALQPHQRERIGDARGDLGSWRPCVL